MHLIIQYILNMFPYCAYSLPAFIIIRVMRLLNLRRIGIHSNLYHEIRLLLFFVYLTGLLSQAILPKFPLLGISDWNVNLILCRVFYDTWRAVVFDHNLTPLIINFAGNIAVFIPLGFFIPLLWMKQTAKKTLGISFLVSLSIEVLQLPQSRCSDIDDLWLNSLGGLTGFGVYFIINRMAPKITEKFKIDRG